MRCITGMRFAVASVGSMRLVPVALRSPPCLTMQLSGSAMPVSAALAAPFFSSVGQVYWERWTGSAIALNLFKCSLATALFVIVVAAQSATGGISPFAALSPKAVRMLAVSSFMGIVVGDAMWLQALSMIGARACILLGALQPCVAALAGAVFLGQPLHARLLLGTALTSTGLVVAHIGRTASLCAMANLLTARLAALNNDWIEQLTEQRRQQDEYGLPEVCQGGDVVVANGIMLGLLELLPSSPSTQVEGAQADSNDRHPLRQVQQGAQADGNDDDHRDGEIVAPRVLAVGYALALTNMALDVLGATLTRAYGVGATTFEVNALRFGFASLVTAAIMACAHMRSALSTWMSAASTGPAGPTHCAPIPAPAWARMPTLSAREWRVVALGVVLVTFLCPALSNYALFRLPLGAWASLTALGPVYAIPIFYVLRREGTRPVGMLGAALASYGATLVSSSLAP